MIARIPYSAVKTISDVSTEPPDTDGETDSSVR